MPHNTCLRPVTKMRVSNAIGVQVETPFWNAECRRESGSVSPGLYHLAASRYSEVTMSTADLGIHEFEAATGVPMRTLRHWVKKGVLPRPCGRGRVARYTESHLIRAQAIKHLRASKVSLREIRQRIGVLNDGCGQRACRTLSFRWHTENDVSQ
jgi:hypothetical protein